MNINRLHLGQFQTHNSKYNYFISVIPGDELSECIGAVVEYCKENNTSAILEFNGTNNRVESWIVPKELANAWYSNPTDVWYQSRRMVMRDNKINEILK